MAPWFFTSSCLHWNEVQRECCLSGSQCPHFLSLDYNMLLCPVLTSATVSSVDCGTTGICAHGASGALYATETARKVVYMLLRCGFFIRHTQCRFKEEIMKSSRQPPQSIKAILGRIWEPGRLGAGQSASVQFI